MTNSITIDSDQPCRFSVQQQVEGEIVMDNVDEGAADSDASGYSSFLNNPLKIQPNPSLKGNNI